MISVLIPLYNEANNLPLLIETLIPVLKQLQRPYEIIFVNDCSVDTTFKHLKQAADRYPEIKVINFSRNSGQTAALMAAVKYAQGEIVVSMDGDLQNDPRDIPRLIEKLEEGYDVISGWRQNRQDRPLRRVLTSRIANQLISWVSGVKLRDYGCSLKAYRRDIIKKLKLYGEMHRFIPIYASWQGARIAEIPVLHHPRRHGQSKYGLERIFKVILDLLVIKFLEKYFTKPIYLFGGVGIFCFIYSFCIGFFCLYFKYFRGISFIQTPLPLLCVTSFLVGTMNILMGLLAEMVARTYFESQKIDIYYVGSTLNTEQKQ